MEKQLKYFNLMEDLRHQILEGEIKPGEKLPSENELSAKYAVSRWLKDLNVRFLRKKYSYR